MDLKFKNCIILTVLTFRYPVSQIIMPRIMSYILEKREIGKVLNHSRLRNKHRCTLINFWDFFPGAMFLIREGNAIFFPKYPLFHGMGDAYSKGYA